LRGAEILPGAPGEDDIPRTSEGRDPIIGLQGSAGTRVPERDLTRKVGFRAWGGENHVGNVTDMINLDQGAVGSSMWKARSESRAFLLQVIIESFRDVLTCSWAGYPRNTKYMLRGFCTVPDGITLHSPFPEWYYLDPSIARDTSVLLYSQPEQEQKMGETFSLQGTNTPCQPRKHV